MSLNENHPLTTRRRIDALCDAFETAWRAGQRPRIEAELEKIESAARDELLKELLLVEWELLGKEGAPIRFEEYVARFPEHETLIRQTLVQRQPEVRFPEVIAHYKILKLLGAGGMGEVFLAEDRRLGRKVALKLLPEAWAKDRIRRQRFLTEARAASSLNHPNVCVIHEVGETAEGQPYLTMEFLEGGTLDKRVAVRPLTVIEVVNIAIQIADALEAAIARGVVHRDLKPGNISINDRGLVKVLDFGLAKIIAERPLAGASESTRHETQTGAILGTPAYMSPEQASGTTVDHRSDLFSLGSVLYELLTGRRPFSGANAAEVIQRIISAQPEAIARFNYEVPVEFERIVRKLLEKEVTRRFQTPADLLADLRNLRRDLESPARPGVPAAAALSSMLAATATMASGAFGVASNAIAKTVMAELVPDGDVLLNFAPVDDQPLYDGRQGWVSQLYRHLSVRMEQLSGERIKLARHPGFTGRHDTDLELQRHLAKVKAMVSVVSPPFVKSEGCVRELQEFCANAEESGGLWVENKPRVFKVLKTPVASGEVPGDVADLFSRLFAFEFFEQDPVTGRIREFDEAFGETLRQRFHERLYDLAYEVCQVLRILKQLQSNTIDPAKAAAHRQVIYLAPTTSDLQTERDRIRRELIERGHMVLPETPLPLSAKELERVVRGHLDKCSMAIHLLGTNYGVTPEDSAESLPCLQVKLSVQHARQKPFKCYFWMPGVAQVTDARQKSFLQQVQEDPMLHDNAEIMEGDLSLLKRELIRWLEPPKPKPSALAAPAAVKSADGPPKVYLICEPRDEGSIEPLEDYLFAQGLDVCLPAFDGSDADAEALHRENLLTCDAAMVYFGAAPRAWVDIKLRELLKAAGSGRSGPIRVQAVYIAPPEDHRKERFRSLQARVIRQGTEFKHDAELEAFVTELKGVGAA